MNKDFFVEETLKQQEKNITQIQKMNKEIKKICSLLIKNSNEFDQDDVKNVVTKIETYINTYDRIAYSVMSNFIFSLSSEIQGTMTTNFDLVVEFVLGKEYEKSFKDDSTYEKDSLIFNDKNLEKKWQEMMNRKYKNEQYSKIRKTIIKMYDHIQLAIHQFENLKQDDKEFQKKFAINMEPVNNEVKNQLNTFTKEMNSQLIALIGIFTAMSFLVFGGINSLEDIFKNAVSIPILQAMIIGTIWGLCVTNLIFVFMFFVSKMTKLEIKSCYRKDANLIEKYPLVFWSELILLTILGICSWLYYIDSKDIGYWFVLLGRKWPTIVSLSGFILILALTLICMIKLVNIKNKCDKINSDDIKNKPIEENCFNEKSQ